MLTNIPYTVVTKDGTHILAVTMIKILHPKEWFQLTSPTYPQKITDLHCGTAVVNFESKKTFVITEIYQEFAVGVRSQVLSERTMAGWNKI